jgi:hypothetical protein
MLAANIDFPMQQLVGEELHMYGYFRDGAGDFAAGVADAGDQPD